MKGEPDGSFFYCLVSGSGEARKRGSEEAGSGKREARKRGSGKREAGIEENRHNVNFYPSDRQGRWKCHNDVWNINDLGEMPINEWNIYGQT